MNYFFLNNGYDGLHHDRPGLHWSLLAKAYEKDYVQHVHPNLNRASLIGYWFESYVYPGKIIDYLGNPVKLISPEKDVSEDWVKEVSVDDFSDDLGAVRK
jgi:beta-carotene hydroxylase